MSRSYAHHPIISHVHYFSNKKDKRSANRKFRRVNKQLLRLDRPLKLIRELSNTYNFASDGLPQWCDAKPEWLRK